MKIESIRNRIQILFKVIAPGLIVKYVVHLLFDVLCHGKFSQLYLHSYLSNSYFEGFHLVNHL